MADFGGNKIIGFSKEAVQNEMILKLTQTWSEVEINEEEIQSYLVHKGNVDEARTKLTHALQRAARHDFHNRSHALTNETTKIVNDMFAVLHERGLINE